jgi:hypothetical protein
MERQLWPSLYRRLVRFGTEVRQVGVTHPPHVILMVLLWAAIHERPVGWAGRPSSWAGTDRRPVALPSAATLSRRLRATAIGILLRHFLDGYRAAAPARLVAILDGKPLIVGACSKDADAKAGRVYGGFARGYKLHAVFAGRAVPEVWCVTPLNASEPVTARGLVGHAPPDRGGYLLADGNYDDGRLYDAAQAAGYAPVTPLPANAGGGHRRQSPARLANRDRLARPFGRDLLRQRGQIERDFGNLTAFGGGLQPLPAWVRRAHRVYTWVAAKLAINAARIGQRLRLLT